MVAFGRRLEEERGLAAAAHRIYFVNYEGLKVEIYASTTPSPQNLLSRLSDTSVGDSPSQRFHRKHARMGVAHPLPRCSLTCNR